jgi:hypothetical protein
LETHWHEKSRGQIAPASFFHSSGTFLDEI